MNNNLDEANAGRSRPIAVLLRDDLFSGRDFATGDPFRVTGYRVTLVLGSIRPFHVFFGPHFESRAITVSGETPVVLDITDTHAEAKTKIESLGVTVDKLTQAGPRWVIEASDEGEAVQFLYVDSPNLPFSSYLGPRVLEEVEVASAIEFRYPNFTVKPIPAGTLVYCSDIPGIGLAAEMMTAGDLAADSYDHLIILSGGYTGAFPPTSGSIDLTYDLPDGAGGFETDTITWDVTQPLATALAGHSAIVANHLPGPVTEGDVSQGTVRIRWANSGIYNSVPLPLPRIDNSSLGANAAAVAAYACG